MTARVRVPAKINLDLQIGARRPDGYHEVSTVMQAVALFDELRLRPAAGGPHLRCSGWPVAAGPGNLAWRAAVAVAAAAARPPDVAIALRKRIPVGAGLGGGSADAAAVLVGLVALWDLPWGAAELIPLAARLGSDVPFFLRGGTALAGGRGERLRALPDRPPQPVLLIKPAYGIDTRDAYAWWDALDVPPAAGRTGGNALEAAVFPRHPDLAAAKAALQAAGARPALLAGSGAAVVGVMPSRSAARRQAAEWRARGWWAASTRLHAGGAEVLA